MKVFCRRETSAVANDIGENRYQLTVPCYPSATIVNWGRSARISAVLGVLCWLIVANGEQTKASQQSQARSVNNILVGAEYLAGIRSLMTVVNFSNDAEKFLSRYDTLTAIQNRLRGAGIATPVESNYRLILDVMTSVQKGGVYYNVSLWLSRPGALVLPSKQRSFTRLIVLERGTMGRVGPNDDARNTVADVVYTLVDRFIALHHFVNAKYKGPLIDDPQKLTRGLEVLGGITALTTEVKIDSDLPGIANENQLASLVNNKLREAGIFVGPGTTTLRLHLNGFPTVEADSYVYLLELKLLRRMYFAERNSKDLETAQGWVWRSYRFGSVPTAVGTLQIQKEVQDLANNFLTDFRKSNPK